ncbi:MAG: hypothetical protein ACRDSE_16260, partial [Pseudonocardiaceae bacterium]
VGRHIVGGTEYLGGFGKPFHYERVQRLPVSLGAVRKGKVNLVGYISQVNALHGAIMAPSLMG